MNEVEILGVRLTAQRYDEAIASALQAARDRRRFRVHFCTVHSLVEATSNPALRSAFASADMVAMDGVPLVWVARRRGFRDAERVCGPDVMLSLCDRGRELGLRHFLLGGRSGVPEALAARLVGQFPGLHVAGVVSPPFRPLATDEERDLISSINESGADVLWVGLGAPKQELWAADRSAALTVPLVMPVGAAFDFHSGRLPRAPRWMRRAGLEWLFRVAAEPRRLAGRYASTNTKFLYLLAREALARRRGQGVPN